MIVEVNAGNAVTWTKPQDLPADATDVAKQTKRIRVDNEFVAILCDGSAHVLRASNLKTLQAVFTIGGGEVVELPLKR